MKAVRWIHSQEENPEVIYPHSAQRTVGTDSIEGALTSTQQPSHQAITRELPPSSIEIIEDAGSQTSSIKGSTEGTKADLLTTRDPVSQPPHSPGYSPSLINMLASDRSSSGESIQSYFARKIKCKEDEETNEGDSSKTLPPIKESDSSLITITPDDNLTQASNLTQGEKSAGTGLTSITFL